VEDLKCLAEVCHLWRWRSGWELLGAVGQENHAVPINERDRIIQLPKKDLQTPLIHGSARRTGHSTPPYPSTAVASETTGSEASSIGIPTDEATEPMLSRPPAACADPRCERAGIAQIALPVTASTTWTLLPVHKAQQKRSNQELF
jgi:hypothetical protein